MTDKIDPRSYRPAANLLTDRVVLITGASDGIGKAVAQAASGPRQASYWQAKVWPLTPRLSGPIR